MSDALLVVDLEGRITSANGSACRLHGGQARDLVGRVLAEVVAELPPGLAQALQPAGSGPGEDGGPVAATWCRRGQVRIPVSLSWALLSDVDPERQALAVTLAESRRDDRGLPGGAGTVERFEALSGAAPVGIFESDERGQLAYVNECLLTIFGTREAEVIGRGWWQAVHPDDRSTLRNRLNRAARGRTEFQSDFRIVRPDGEVRWVNSVSSIISLSEAGKDCRVGTITDITDRVRAQEALLEHQQELEELSAQLTFVEERQRRVISAELHDGVGQNLVAIKIKVGMLQSEGLGETGQTMVGEALTLVDEAIKDVWSLTFELCPPMLYEVGLTAAIDWLLGQFRQRHGLELSLRGEDKDVPLSDEARGALFQCVRELLQNVVKHAEAGRAEVSLQVAAGFLVIQVSDDGAGFVPPLVFPEDADQGSFGLFMVRERMRQLGGRVEYDCAEGKGSRIGLHMPVDDGRAAADDRAGAGKTQRPAPDLGGLAHQLNDLLSVVLGLGSLLEQDVPTGATQAADVTAILFAARRAASLSRKLSARAAADGHEERVESERVPVALVARQPLRGRGTLLVVDDQELVRSAAQRILERMGYHVLVAENGLVGLEVYRAHDGPIDVVLLDVLMPVMAGDELFEELMAIDPDVKVLLCTGAAETGLTEDLLARGALGIVEKPFDARELGQAIAQAFVDGARAKPRS
ncbi:MAG: PAS domain S-box protein [Deltaproteobacteria bacterium]|nr:PAS domain S-box protein [Deltaproteobacteria bacterium]